MTTAGLVDLDVVAGVVDRHQVRGGRQRRPCLLALVPRLGEACHLGRRQAGGQFAIDGGDDGHRQRPERDDAGHFGEGGDDVEVLAVARWEEAPAQMAEHVAAASVPSSGDGAEGGGPRGGGGVDEDESADLVGVAAMRT